MANIKKGATILGLGMISFCVWTQGSEIISRNKERATYFGILILSAIDAGFSAGRINRNLELSTNENMDGVYLTYSFPLTKRMIVRVV